MCHVSVNECKSVDFEHFWVDHDWPLKFGIREGRFFCLNSLLKSVDFELFLVNHDSGPKMNMCHVFQPACCSMVSLNLYIYIYMHLPSEPLECDPFRFYFIFFGKQVWFRYIFPTVQIANWSLCFYKIYGRQLQQAAFNSCECKNQLNSLLEIVDFDHVWVNCDRAPD